MNTYSQTGEDSIIKFIFDNLKISKPSYIDIGAYHPVNLNNTALFYEQGCSGINIEPNPVLFNEFLIQRKRDVNLNIGITEEKGIMPFYVMNYKTMSVFKKRICRFIYF